MSNKVKTFAQIQKLSQTLRKSGKKIVFTNGCFDILHAGHVTYLRKARAFGDVLIVGLNSDRSVRLIKGPGRPVNPEKARALVLSALDMVSYVTSFDEETPLRLIKAVRPHTLVKGADWKVKDIAGAREVTSWGGTVKRVKMLAGFSTTETLRKCQTVSKACCG